jgi:hypothetical protein
MAALAFNFEPDALFLRAVQASGFDPTASVANAPPCDRRIALIAVAVVFSSNCFLHCLGAPSERTTIAVAHHRYFI